METTKSKSRVTLKSFFKFWQDNVNERNGHRNLIIICNAFDIVIFTVCLQKTLCFVSTTLTFCASFKECLYYSPNKNQY